MNISQNVSDMENISAELQGVLGQVTALQIGAAEEVILSPIVLHNCLYGLQRHLERIVNDFDKLISDAYKSKKSESEVKKAP